jgi:hypothetical protein
MERNGYGPNFCKTERRNGVIGINDDTSTKQPTHYYVSCDGDSGLEAAAREAVKAANKGLPNAEKGLFRKRFKSGKGKAKIRKILENAQLKRKAPESDADDDIVEQVQ